MKSAEEFKEKIEYLQKQTEEFKKRFNEMLGITSQGIIDPTTSGIWYRINQKHLRARNNLLEKQNIDSLTEFKRILSYQEKILNACTKGLEQYQRVLNNLNKELTSMFNIKICKNIFWYIRYIEVLIAKSKEIKDRLIEENKIIERIEHYYDKHQIIDPFELTQLTNVETKEAKLLANLVDNSYLEKIHADVIFLREHESADTLIKNIAISTKMAGSMLENSGYAKAMSWFFSTEEDFLKDPRSPAWMMLPIFAPLITITWGIVDAIQKISLVMKTDHKSFEQALSLPI